MGSGFRSLRPRVCIPFVFRSEELFRFAVDLLGFARGQPGLGGRSWPAGEANHRRHCQLQPCRGMGAKVIVLGLRQSSTRCEPAVVPSAATRSASKLPSQALRFRGLRLGFWASGFNI